MSTKSVDSDASANRVAIINGPNNNFYGIRDTHQYGDMMYDDLVAMLKDYAETQCGFEVTFFQSNHEGAIIDELQRCYRDGVDGIVLNPGALTHYSYSLYDAILSVFIPTVEVHMSNIHKRDEFRHKSVTAPACVGQIAGFGPESYKLAMHALQWHLAAAGR